MFAIRDLYSAGEGLWIASGQPWDLVVEWAGDDGADLWMTACPEA
jgi:hypothetical protein